MASIYENIRKTRIEKGISQSELAEAVGYTSKAMISQIENGKINLSMDKLDAIAKAMGVKASDLWDWSDFDYLDSGTEDADILLLYHRLTPTQQDLIINMILQMLK